MPKQDRIAQAVQEHHNIMRETFSSQGVLLTALAQRVVQTFHSGGRLFICGNGTLAALADITEQLFLHRMVLERPSLPAHSLCHDGKMAQLLARDDQAQHLFMRQLKTLAGEHDLLLVYADGSDDPAINEVCAGAVRLGLTTALVMPAKGACAAEQPQMTFRFASDSPARLAEGVLLFAHLLCDLVEAELFGV